MDWKKLPIEQKMELLSGAGWWNSKGVPGVVASFSMSDGPHGLRLQKQDGGQDHLGIHQAEEAVAYPAESTLASSFDPRLLEEVAASMGREARSHHVDMLLAPAMNIKRNPLCGRNFEYYSEDPYLTGQLAGGFVRGLQKEGVGACIKHFCCNNIEYRRNYSDSVVSPLALRNIYLKAFEDVIATSDPWGLMFSYNLVNGERVAESHYLLHDVLKEEFGYRGVIVSDWGAVWDATKSVKAGMSLQMPEGDGAKKLMEDYASGQIKEEEIDEALESLVHFANRPKKPAQPYSREEALALVRRAARESQVLLKNKESFFPFRKAESILVVGPLAKNPRYQGNGSSHVSDRHGVSLLEAFDQMGVSYDYVEGYPTHSKELDFESVKAAAKGKQKILFVLGNEEDAEGEGYDRASMSLPFNQMELMVLSSVLGIPMGALLFVGSPVELPFRSYLNGLMYCGLPGESGCLGVADIIYGLHAPSGHLSETWAEKMEDYPSFWDTSTDGTMVFYFEGPYVGYRYFHAKRKKVAYPFGFGLTYGELTYSHFHFQEKEEEWVLRFDVNNDGPYSLFAVPQLYLSYPRLSFEYPKKNLIRFQKIAVGPKSTVTAEFTFGKEDLRLYDVNGKKFLPGGEYVLHFASNAEEDVREFAFTLPLDLPDVDECTPPSQIILSPSRKELFEKIILGGMKKAFGVEEVPNHLLKIVYEIPLKSLRKLCPAIQNDQDFASFLTQINALR